MFDGLDATIEKKGENSNGGNLFPFSTMLAPHVTMIKCFEIPIILTSQKKLGVKPNTTN